MPQAFLAPHRLNQLASGRASGSRGIAEAENDLFHRCIWFGFYKISNNPYDSTKKSKIFRQVKDAAGTVLWGVGWTGAIGVGVSSDDRAWWARGVLDVVGARVA
jgi:hypothetical protein